MSRSHKRRKVIQLGVPEENDADLPTAHTLANAPSSTAWSTREILAPHPHSLSMLCMMAFAQGLQKLASSPPLWKRVQAQLREFPETLLPRLFDVLKTICPSILNHAFIAAYFLRGDVIRLSDELPGVTQHTIQAIGIQRMPEQLVELHLRKLEKISDDLVASLLRKLPSLKILNLRECLKVGPKSAEAAGTSCSGLVSVNFSYTAVTPISMSTVLKQCKSLEVLKLAGISNWTDATVGKLFTDLELAKEFKLSNLKTLKLRQTSVTDHTINTFISICPDLRRLDLSFTAVHHPPLLLGNSSLEKLSLTSTRITSANLLKVIAGLRGLKTLSLGALGRSESSVGAISNSSAMTMTDETLRKLTACLVECHSLESVNLVGNSKLGVVSRSALVDFIRQVGRRCKTLNLSSIPSLRSSDLEFLLPTNLPPSPLESLILNNTGVDDGVAPFIGSCASLEVLEVGSTKLTYDGLCAIVSSCKSLRQLNLTSCRGVEVAHRRRFFEIYEESLLNQGPK